MRSTPDSVVASPSVMFAFIHRCYYRDQGKLRLMLKLLLFALVRFGAVFGSPLPHMGAATLRTFLPNLHNNLAAPIVLSGTDCGASRHLMHRRARRRRSEAAA